MPEVLEETAPPVVETVPDYHDLQGANGRFTPGNRGGPGRPKGSRNYAKVLHQAAPKLAKAYVTSALRGNATVLVDSRKYFLPDDLAAQPSVGIVVLTFEADTPLSVVAASAATLTLPAASSPPTDATIRSDEVEAQLSPLAEPP